jgi:hypothetical protein
MFDSAIVQHGFAVYSRADDAGRRLRTPLSRHSRGSKPEIHFRGNGGSHLTEGSAWQRSGGEGIPVSRCSAVTRGTRARRELNVRQLRL